MRVNLLAVLAAAVSHAAVAGAQGCSRLPLTCTDLGCNDGLTVELAAPPAVPYRVEVAIPDDPARAVECAEATHCPRGTVFFQDVTAEEVTVRVVTAQEARSATVRPDYETVRPNGRGCDPVCRRGRVSVQFPG